MNIQIGQPGMMPGVSSMGVNGTPAGGPGAANRPGLEQGIEQKPAFIEQLQQNQANPTGATNGTQVARTEAVNKNESVVTQISTRRVNEASSAKSADLFARFDNIRADMNSFVHKTAEFDKMVAEGKIKPNDPRVAAAHRDEMRQLLFFQSEMQSAAMKVEIASKVVEHGTSGVKTVLQTQA